jgi:AAA+ ATPase superfamily predicted ATPase
MFVGRERELRDWERRWDGLQAELIVLYGRRRVGKSALARRFSEGRPTVYFTGVPVRDADNRRAFAAAMGDEGVSFDSWEAAWDRLLERSRGERLLVVLDEFPALAGSHPGLAGRLQRWWDARGASSRLFVILSGSSLGFIEREVLSHQSPLFGRRTASVKLEPLAPWEVARFVPTADVVARMTTHGLFGGVPAYLERVLAAGGWQPFLRREAFAPGGYLFEEVPFLLNTELREPSTYLSLLAALASGATRQTEVADRARLEVSSVGRYLATLMELGLVKRETPFLDPRPDKSRKGLYQVADPFVRFWCAHILPARSLIQAGLGERHLVERVLPQLPAWLGPAFEADCRAWVERRWQETHPAYALRVGRQWHKERDGSLTEIDLVADLSDGSRLVAECKATRQPVGPEVLLGLKERAARLPANPGGPTILAVFALAGLAPAARDTAVREGVEVVEGPAVYG